MKVFEFIFCGLLCLMVGIAQAGVCPGSNVIEDPPSFQWVDAGGYFKGTLEIGEATFTIGNDTLTTRAYRQEGGTFSIPGPTMRMTPGETYVLTFENTLPYEEPSGAHNDLKDPNITNIHTHGLHVSGETPSDDVTRVINGGYCADYVYEVPSNHMGGTLWYHAHHHGSTYLQVAAGAFGLLLVDDSQDGIPANVAGMTERQLAVAYLDPGVAGVGGDTLISGTLSPTWTVNGKVNGNLCTPANEWQHWRVLLADRDARSKTLSVEPTNACEVALMSRDGVWRTVAPKNLANNAIELTGASRADLAVRCSADATIRVNGTVVANVFADSSLPANLVVGPLSNGATGTTWSALRPSYLRDLRGEPVVQNRSVNMGARTINGSKFDLNAPTFSISAGSVQEWNIKGANMHPFHQHIYHVQMQGDCENGTFEDGEYYDTVSGNCLVRFDLNPQTSSVYDGRTIMHCHILIHEDQGAMGWSDVLGGFPPPISPDPNHQDLYQCGEDPPTCTPTEPAEVTCNDGKDNDCNGLIDGDDPNCCQVTEQPETSCSDGIDNDCDGLVDTDDPDCPPPPQVDCSIYTTRSTCNGEPTNTCRWDNRNGVCITK